MIRRDYFSHSTKGRNESACGRVKRFGYRWRTCGENIAWGSGSKGWPKNIMKNWMESSGHKRNILNREFRQIGIGTRTGTYKGNKGVTMYTAQLRPPLRLSLTCPALNLTDGPHTRLLRKFKESGKSAVYGVDNGYRRWKNAPRDVNPRKGGSDLRKLMLLASMLAMALFVASPVVAQQSGAEVSNAAVQFCLNAQAAAVDQDANIEQNAESQYGDASNEAVAENLSAVTFGDQNCLQILEQEGAAINANAVDSSGYSSGDGTEEGTDGAVVTNEAVQFCTNVQTADVDQDANIEQNAESQYGDASNEAAAVNLSEVTFGDQTCIQILNQAGFAVNEPAPQPEPKPDEPKPDEPKPDEPKPDEPKPDEPKPDEPKPDEPKPDEPKPDEPKPDEPKPDEPKPDEPKPDEPKPDEQYNEFPEEPFPIEPIIVDGPDEAEKVEPEAPVVVEIVKDEATPEVVVEIVKDEATPVTVVKDEAAPEQVIEIVKEEATPVEVAVVKDEAAPVEVVKDEAAPEQVIEIVKEEVAPVEIVEVEAETPGKEVVQVVKAEASAPSCCFCERC